MDSDHVLVVFMGLVLVGAAVALAYSSPAVFGDDSDGVSDANLASFETTDTYCGDPNTTSGSAVSQDVDGGEALVLNQSLPVATNDTEVSGSLEDFGPQRYILQITSETPEATPTSTPDTETPTATPVPDTETPVANETGENESTNATGGTNETETERATATDEATPTPTPTDAGSECHPEVRYNASIHVAHPDEYTVIVTYDGEFVAAHWRDGSDGGSYDTIPEQPEAEEGQNATAVTSD